MCPENIAATTSSSVPAHLAPGGSGGGDYTIKWGDTLSALAQRFGTDVQTLAKANGIANPDLIMADAKLIIPGGPGRGDAGSGMAGPASPLLASMAALAEAGNAAAMAQRYLGRNASDLEADKSSGLAAGVPANECCANFVSAMLVKAGQLPPDLHTNGVTQLESSLKGRGWQAVGAADAKPGDVVIIRGHGVEHTELIAGPGQMIGSNNSNADGTQKVGKDSLSWALQAGATILRAP